MVLKETATRFSFYFPPASEYQGRFFNSAFHEELANGFHAGDSTIFPIPTPQKNEYEKNE